MSGSILRKLKKILTISMLAILIAIASLVLERCDAARLTTLEELALLPCWKRMEQANNYFNNGKDPKAIEIYDRALEICDPSQHSLILRYKGFALFNLGINNETVRIAVRGAAHASAEGLINYSCNYTLVQTSRDHLMSALECFKEVSRNDPGDLQTLLYKSILALYLSPSPDAPDPVDCFNNVITAIDSLPSDKQENRVVRDIRYLAWYGKGTAYLKMGEEGKAEECFRKSNEVK